MNVSGCTNVSISDASTWLDSLAPMNLDPALLDILVCPQCRATLLVVFDSVEMVWNSCKLA
jgi:hypothetical protein